MIGIECSNCNRMIEIDSTQVQPVKVTCYLMLCRDCQIESKNNERDNKLKKVLRRGMKERIMNFVNSVLDRV
jgi:hypothetical protein